VRDAWLVLPFVGLLAGASASATTFSFDCVTGSGTGCRIGEAQFSLEVAAAGNGLVSFTLHNEGDKEITAVGMYVDDDAHGLASLVSVIDGPGVNFEAGGSPKDLPGGHQEDFDADFRATAAQILRGDGVNTGEQVVMVFSLNQGKTVGDVLSALADEDLRIGVLAIAFGECSGDCKNGDHCDNGEDGDNHENAHDRDRGKRDEGDDEDGDDGDEHDQCNLCDLVQVRSFINNPEHVVPEPSVLSLLVLGLGGAFVRRR